MRKYVVKLADVRNEMIVVSAARFGGRIKVEAACAVTGRLTDVAIREASVRIAMFPGGTAVVSSAEFDVCDDRSANYARFAHALFGCCTAVLRVKRTKKEVRADGKTTV